MLTPIREIKDINEIVVGRDGIIISKGRNHGLLLPQVAADYGWDRITFLEQTCNKAQLPLNSWKDKDTKLVERTRAGTRLLAAVQAGLAVIPLLWALILWIHSAFPGSIPALEACFYILTALSGIAGGLQFPVADSLYRISSPGKRAGLGAIYGVDLAGSSIGALITGSLMIPILGMIPVLLFFSVLNAVTAGVLWIRNLTG